MNSILSIPERVKVDSTLICLLRSIRGKVTTVELRDECSVRGIIEHVDAAMNVSVSNCLLIDKSGKQHHLELFYVRGNNIRYVHIPDSVDIVSSIKREIYGIKKPTGQQQHREDRISILTKAITQKANK